MKIAMVVCLMTLSTLGNGDPVTNRLTALRFGENEDSWIYFTPAGDMGPISEQASVCVWLKNPADSPADNPCDNTVFTYNGNNFKLSGKGCHNYVIDPYEGRFPYPDAPSSVTAVLPDWHHVCLTFSAASEEARYYVNGELVESKTITGTIETNNRNVVTIGNHTPGYENSYFGGEMTDLNVWAKTLSGEEVSEMYKAGLCSLEADKHEESKVVSWEEILEDDRNGDVTEFTPTNCTGAKTLVDELGQLRDSVSA